MTKQQLRTTITARAMQQRTYTYINTHINMRWYIFALTNRMNMNMYPCFYWFNAADAPCSYEIFLPRPQPPHASSQKVRHRSQRTNCDNLYENDVHMYVHPIYHIQSYVNLYRVYKYICVYIFEHARQDSVQLKTSVRVWADVSCSYVWVWVSAAATELSNFCQLTLLENCQQLYPNSDCVCISNAIGISTCRYARSINRYSWNSRILQWYRKTRKRKQNYETHV